MTRPGVPLLAALCLGLLATEAGAQPADAWRPFSGTWSLTGERHAVATEGPHRAAIVHVSGSLVLSAQGDLGPGLSGEAVGYDDGAGLLTGRAVFTDAHGDRVFATLKAESIGTGRRATGTITGGTGRFAGLEGEFTFSWQYVVEPESGEIALRAVNLEGRARRRPR